jgi:hypothetical protein
LSNLQLKPKFLNYSEKLSEADWNSVNTKIKSAFDGGFHATAVKDGNDFIFVDIFRKNNDKKQTDAGLSILNTTGYITSALANSDLEYTVGNMNYNLGTNKFQMDLMAVDDTFNPLAGDEWRKGHFFDFNSQQFRTMPMFERLACSNGMTTRQKAFASNIAQGKFNDNRVIKEVNKALLTSSDVVELMVQNHIQRLNNMNVSINEFAHWKNWLSNLDDGAQADNIDKLMPMQPFFVAYKSNPEDHTAVWRKTADTGLSAYKMLNLATWVGSHNDVTQFTSDAKKEIQIQAANFLFKKELDLENMAEKVKIEYPESASML